MDTQTTEPTVTEEAVTPVEHTDTPQEPTSIKPELTGEAFVQELQYGTESDMSLHLHLVDNTAVDADGKLTDKTIELARSTGMDESTIEAHQQAIYKEMEQSQLAIHKVYEESCSELGLSVGYMDEVVNFMKQSFTPAEIKVFERDWNNNPTDALRSLEAYYILEAKDK